MKSEVAETQSDEHSQGKGEQNKPPTQWKKILKGTRQDFSSRHVWNLIYLLIGALIGPVVGYFMKGPKGIIAGISLALTVVIWLIAYHMIKQVDAHNEQPIAVSATSEPTNAAPPPSSAIPVPTPTAPAAAAGERYVSQMPTGKNAPPAPPVPTPPGKEQPERAMSDKKDSRSITNSPITNSPGSVQNLGDNVTINQTPPPWPTKAETDKLLAILRDQPKGMVAIYTMWGNADSIRCGEALRKVLDSSGWRIGEQSQLGDPNPPSGIIVGVHSRDAVPPYAAPLVRAFRAIGWPAFIEADPRRYDDGQISLVVGYRP